MQTLARDNLARNPLVRPTPRLPPFKYLHLSFSVSFVFMAGVCLSPPLPNITLFYLVFSIGQSELVAGKQHTLHKLIIYFNRLSRSRYNFSFNYHIFKFKLSLFSIKFVHPQRFDNTDNVTTQYNRCK